MREGRRQWRGTWRRGGGSARQQSRGEGAVGQRCRQVGVIKDLESWILQAESGSNSKEGELQGRSDQSAGRSTMAEAPRRRVRRKKCEAEERKHWDQHSKIPRRKPGKGKHGFSRPIRVGPQLREGRLQWIGAWWRGGGSARQQRRGSRRTTL